MNDKEAERLQIEQVKKKKQPEEAKSQLDEIGTHIFAAKDVSITLGHLIDQRSVSDGILYESSQRVTTQYHSFSINLSPESGPPGERRLLKKFQCPVCNAEIELKCIQETVLFTKPSDFETESGMALKQAVCSHIWSHSGFYATLSMWVLFAGGILLVAFKALLEAFLKIDLPILLLLPAVILFFIVVLRIYRYIMLSYRPLLFTINTPKQFRQEFHNATNVFVRISMKGNQCVWQIGASAHFIVDDTQTTLSKFLLKQYGVFPCKLFL